MTSPIKVGRTASDKAKICTLHELAPDLYKQVQEGRSLRLVWSDFTRTGEVDLQCEMNLIMTLCMAIKRGISDIAGLTDSSQIEQILTAEDHPILGSVVERRFPDGIDIFLNEHSDRFISCARSFIEYLEARHDNKLSDEVRKNDDPIETYHCPKCGHEIEPFVTTMADSPTGEKVTAFSCNHCGFENGWKWGDG